MPRTGQAARTIRNPRGGSRGGRGAAAIGDMFVVANYDTLLVYDRDWSWRTGSLTRCFSASTSSTGMVIACMRRRPHRRGARVDVRHADGGVAWDPRIFLVRRRFRISQVASRLIDAYAGPRKIDQVHLNGVACIDDGLVVNCGLVRPTASLSSTPASSVWSQARGPTNSKPRWRGGDAACTR